MPEPQAVLFDITRPVHSGMPVWPGDAPCRVGWTLRMDRGEGVNVAELSASVHCGTHVDAPLHVLPDGARVADLPLEAFVGPARVVDARNREWIDVPQVEALLAEGPVERVLFRTGCWTDPHIFPTRFPALVPEAAARLCDAGARLLGTDAPSVDPFESAALPAHQALARAGVAIVENLQLEAVEPGWYELLALPLRLTEADAAPLRAALRPLR